jgi:hypothetical protein
VKTRSQKSGVRSQKLTKEQRRAVKSLIEDSGYTRAEAIAIVLAGGLE